MPEFIPLFASVHFKAAFDVSSTKVRKLMTHIRQNVRAWCINKVGTDDQTLHRSWFYIGNNPKVEPAQYVLNDFQIRTASAQSANPDEPICWALEMIHPDFEERARRWSVEITLRKSDDGLVRFTTIVKNWMIANFIGEYPTPPAASAPAYVRSLLADPSLVCSKGKVALQRQYVAITSKSCHTIYNQLVSNERQAPFVLVAHDPNSNSALVNPARVAAALIGNANVFAMPQVNVIDEMNYYLGDALRCEYGSIRVYLPYVDKSNPANARVHRYLSASFIAQYGEDSILRMLTNGLARNGNTFRASDLTSIGDVFTVRRRAAIRKLATESQDVRTESQELASKSERLAIEKQQKSEEASLAWEECKMLTEEAALYQSTAEQFETENEELKTELSEMRYRIDEANRVRQRLKDLESQVEGLHNLSSMPTSLSEVLEVISGLFPTRVVVMASAIASADEYSEEHDRHWCKPEQLAVAWEMVFGVATKLYDLVFMAKSRRLETEFSESFSTFELAMSEGKMTKKDGKLMALRKLTFDKKEFDMSPHIKYGNRKPKLLRLHFGICRDTERLILGHFGDHLDNYSTRKQ